MYQAATVALCASLNNYAWCQDGVHIGVSERGVWKAWHSQELVCGKSACYHHLVFKVFKKRRLLV